MAQDKKVKIIIEYSSNDKEAVAAAKRIEAAVTNAGKKGSDSIDEMSSSTMFFANAAGEFVGGIARGAFEILTSKIQQGVEALFDYSSQLEVTRTGFNQLTGSATSTKIILDKIREFSTEKGLDNSFVTDTERDMLRLQVSTKDTLTILDTMADTVASLAGDEKMTKQLTSISVDLVKASKLSLDTIKQFESAGVPAERIWKALEIQTGKTRQELMYLIRDSKVSSDVIFESLKRFNEQNNFGDAAEKQTQTFSGAITKLANILLTEGEKAFEPYFNKISEFTQKTAIAIQEKGVWATTGEVIGQGIAAGVMLGIRDVPQQTVEYIFNRTATFVDKIKKGKFDEASEEIPVIGGAISFGKNIARGIIKQAGFGDKLKEFDDRNKLQTAIASEDGGLKLPTQFDPDRIQKEIERQKQALEIQFKSRLDVITQNLRIEEAAANNHLRLTAQDEITYANQVKTVRQNSIKQQIDLQKSYFDQQIALSVGDTRTITKLTEEKNRVLRGLSTEYALNEINTQKQIAEIERRILESRRQAQIQNKQLTLREITQVTNSGAFDITRNIGFGVDVQSNFEKLKNLTNTSYQQIVKITRESYELQLKNERLTNEERVNLQRQMFLDIQNLAEQNRQKQIQISDDQYKEQINLLENYQRRSKELFDSTSSIYGSLGSFINSSTFNVNSAKGLDNAFTAPIKVAENRLMEIARLKSQAEAALKVTSFAEGTIGRNAIKDKIKEYTEDFSLAFKTFERLNWSISGNIQGILDLANAMAQGKKGIEGFDEANRLLLDTQQKREKWMLEKEVSYTNQLLDFAKGRGDEKGVIELTHRLNILTNQQLTQNLQHSAESLDQYNKSLAGMRENLQKLLNGDIDSWLGFYRDLEITNISNQISQIKELAQAQNEFNKKQTFNPIEAQLELTGYLNQNVKSVTQSYVDFRTTIADGAFQQIDSPFERLRNKLEGLPPLIKGIASAFVNLANDMVRAFSQKLISQILGVGSGQSSGGGFSVGNLLQRFLGGNGSQSSGGFSSPGFAGGTFNIPSNNFSFAGAGGGNNFAGSISRFVGSGGSSFNPISLLSRNSSSFPLSTEGTLESTIGLRGGGTYSTGSMVTNAATSQLSNYTKFKSLFSGKGNLLGSLAPMLGMSLGGSLGGQSTAGQILGSIGGLAGGLLGGIATGAMNAGTMLGGIFGSSGALGIGGLSAAMSATVVLAPIAGALLIGSLLLKRNAARRRDETTRNDLMLKTLEELNKIKSEMQSARPGTNIQGLLDQTGEISGEYFKQANALKDKKTRGIAIKDGNERVGVVPPNSGFPNALTNQIYALSQGAKLKEEMRIAAADRDRLAIPEFAMGGYIPARRGGHLAVVGEGGFDEFILSTDPKYANRTERLLGSFIEKMNYKVPKFEMGGISSGANLSQSNTPASFGNNAPIYVNISIDSEVNSEAIVVKGIKTSSDAKREIIVTIEDAAKDDKLKLERRK